MNRTFLEHLGLDGVDYDEKLHDASAGQLLSASLRMGDDDPVEGGIHAIHDELELFNELDTARNEGGGTPIQNAICTMQSRLKVLAELHRRALEQAGKELAAALAAPAPKKKGGAK